MGQVGPDFISPHIPGVAFVVEQNKVSNVVNIGLFSLEAEVPEPNDFSNLVE
jgi:hypothetical protein